MKFDISRQITHLKTQCIIVPIFEGGKLSAAANVIDDACHGVLREIIKRKDMAGKQGQVYWLPLFDITPASKTPRLPAQRILLIGCGKVGELSVSSFNTLAQKIASQLRQHPVTDVALCLEELRVKDRDIQWQARVIAQALQLGQYHFDQHKSQKEPRPEKLQKVTWLCTQTQHQRACQQGFAIGSAIAKGMCLAKDLGNTPGNVCTPTYLASQARQLARLSPKLHCKVLEEKQMRTLGMGALLSVTSGTVQPAKLIVLEYKGGKAGEAPHVLVGKGITFDTGGISLKPGAGMDEMKYDMCGAASVLGALRAIVELRLPINLVGIIAAAENMPGSKATKPGDIVTAMNGQTIEILNTDAEGRLVLCDALTYSERYKPQSVVDIATLTGACVVALGSHAHGLYSNQDDMAQALLEAGLHANDRGWQLPLWEEYDKQLKSPFADMANIGGPNAGSVTAACFLGRFAKKLRWAHLDIAGTAWDKNPKGATGRPVPLLVQYLLTLSAQNRKTKTPSAAKRRHS